MRRLTLPVLATLVALGASGVQAAAEPPKAPVVVDSTIVDIVAQDATSVELFVQQTWVGEHAMRMRQSLDVFFGASDKSLTPSELDRIALAAEADMVNRPLTWVMIGGAPATVDNVTVTFGNATGRIDDGSPLSMVHSLRLRAEAATTGERLDLVVDPPANGTLSIQPPAGWHLSSAESLETTESTEGFTRGTIRKDRPVTLALLAGAAPEPTPPTEPSPVGPTQESTWEQATPGVPLVGILATLATLGVIVGRRKRRTDGKR